jgi:mono/diheme cytochrome c family protein
MRKRLTFLGIVAAVAGAPAQAADLAQGEALYQQHCVSCHASLTGGKPESLFTRKDRRVTSLEGLKKQVRRCELSLGLMWFADDIDNVSAYLNQRYYRFGS